MPPKTQTYRQVFDLHADLRQLWQLVADTNRLNADMGSAPVDHIPDDTLDNARLRFRYSAGGVPSEYIQDPYEWVQPYQYGVVRRHKRGPYSSTNIQLHFEPSADGSTRLISEAQVTPRHRLGALFGRLAYGIIGARRMRKTIAHYETLAQAKQRPIESLAYKPLLAQETVQNLEAMRLTLWSTGADHDAVDRLVTLIERGDDISVARIRPYALADRWGLPRRAVLEACLYATRIGLLSLRWDLLCPLCRGAKQTASSLSALEKRVHCDVCRIDYEVNFERSVELTFQVNAAIRETEAAEFCIAGPQVTPHVAIQQLLAAGERRSVRPQLDIGRYRMRTLKQIGWAVVEVSLAGAPAQMLTIMPTGWEEQDITIHPNAALTLVNDSDEEQLIIIERTEWSDQAVIAADVTAMQTFRDLFSSEALRPNEQILVGKLTVLFTDLRGSTQMYRRIGDAPAFGLVMEHFDVLKRVIAEHNGALVKTIGDAVMAVFRRPADAVMALLAAQDTLRYLEGSHPIILKAGIHTGPCIAVTLNDRLDYFGTTVNLAARLEGFSKGDDIILSQAVLEDEAVMALLADETMMLECETFEATLKGFDDNNFTLARLRKVIRLLEFA